MGSFPLRTYLPDSDIDIAVLVTDSQNTHLDAQVTLRKILDALYCAAMQSEPQDASHTLRNISFVNAKTPVVRCTVGNIDLDVTVNQLGSLGAITFLEEANRFIGKQHLLKRSLLLLKVMHTLRTFQCMCVCNCEANVLTYEGGECCGCLCFGCCCECCGRPLPSCLIPWTRYGTATPLGIAVGA